MTEPEDLLLDTEPKDLLLANEHLRRSNRRWKALALAECAALVFILLFGFFAVTTARMRAVAALRAERNAAASAHQARGEIQKAVNPPPPR
jgi:hypothetical protein